MGYKLVCIDMDGTLLNSRKQISEITKNTLRRAHEKGVHIVISTGRTYVDAEYYANLIGIQAPIIAANGAYIQDKERHQLIYQSLLSEKLALRILNICKQYHVSPSFHTHEREYYTSILLIIRWKLSRLKNRIKRNESGVQRKYIPSYRQLKRIIGKEQDHILKCVVIQFFNKEKLDKIRTELSRIAELEIAS